MSKKRTPTKSAPSALAQTSAESAWVLEQTRAGRCVACQSQEVRTLLSDIMRAMASHKAHKLGCGKIAIRVQECTGVDIPEKTLKRHLEAHQKTEWLAAKGRA